MGSVTMAKQDTIRTHDGAPIPEANLPTQTESSDIFTHVTKSIGRAVCAPGM